MKYNSVLNTDSYDRRRFGEILAMSPKMKQLESEGRQILPSFYSLLGDNWAGLFKMAPEINSEIDPSLRVNQALMQRVMADEEYQKFREHTRLDDITSAIGTVNYGEVVLKWFEGQEQHNQELSEALEQFRQANGKKQKNEALESAAQALESSFEQHGHALSKALAAAGEDAVQTTDALKSLLGGIQPGSGAAEMKKVPLRDKLLLAEKISKEQKLKEIAEWAGRFKQIARMKQRSKHKESIDRNGVTIGNQIENLLPSELATYSSPLTRLDFMRRFVEGQTMQYDTKGKEQLGKGPIILCLDQSGSMDCQDTMSKGFVLALMGIARRQRRDFGLILFSNKAEKRVFEKGKIGIQDMVCLAETFLYGGTDFQKPLILALELLQQSRFKKADIVFVTDGEADLTTRFLENWHEQKREKDFFVLSILLGSAKEITVNKFSDGIVRASDFKDESVYQAFEI